MQATFDTVVHPDQVPRISSTEGIRFREDTLYSNHAGKVKRGIRKRTERALSQLREPLSRFLESDEVVLYVARGQAPASFLERYTMGMAAHYTTAAILVLTDRRLLAFLVKRSGGWKRSLRSLRWGDVREAQSKGSLLNGTLRLQYRNGVKETYWGLRREDAKKIQVLLQAVTMTNVGRTSPAEAMVSLCPNCATPLSPGVYRCGACFLAFKDEKTMLRRSLLLPGGGYFYTRHPLLGVADFVVETYLGIILLLFTLVALGVIPDIEVDPAEEPLTAAGAGFFAAFLAILFVLEKLITIHHSRRFVRDFIPKE